MLQRPSVPLGIAGLLLVATLSACNSSSNTAISPTPVTSPTSVASPGNTHGGGDHDHGNAQVVEVPPYHLGLATEKQANSLVLNLDLQKGDAHTPVTNAKVQAKIQLPDGSTQTLDLKYDVASKHYVATLASAAPGAYQIAIMTDISGEQINGRFRVNL